MKNIPKAYPEILICRFLPTRGKKAFKAKDLYATQSKQ